MTSRQEEILHNIRFLYRVPVAIIATVFWFVPAFTFWLENDKGFCKTYLGSLKQLWGEVFE